MLGPDVRIGGYSALLGARLADASALLDQPGFWRIYFATAMGWDEDIDAVPGALELYENVLSKPEAWPVISVRLATKHWLRIVYRNLDGDMGIDILVDSEHGGPAPAVAARGDYAGPGMCWEEVAAVAAMPDDALTHDQRLFLCLPVLGGELPVEAIATVEAALAKAGLADWPNELAPKLLADTPTDAQFVIRQGVRMCLASSSYRHVQDLSLSDLQRIDEAFGAKFYRNDTESSGYGHREAGRAVGRWRYTVAEVHTEGGRRMLLGQLDGEIRDQERACVGASLIDAVRLHFVDNASGQLAIAIDSSGPDVRPGDLLLPVD